MQGEPVWKPLWTRGGGNESRQEGGERSSLQLGGEIRSKLLFLSWTV